MFSASSFVALYCSPPSIINTLAFLSRFSVLCWFFCYNLFKLYSTTIQFSSYFHRSHTFVSVLFLYKSCFLFVWPLSSPGTVVRVGLLHGLLILRVCVFVFSSSAFVCLYCLPFKTFRKRILFFLFCFCICYQWHIVRNLSYRSILIEFCVNAFSFFFFFFCSIKLMDSHGFFLRFLLLLLLSEIFVLLKFLLFKKRAVVFAVLCFFIFLCFFSVEILRQFWTLFCFRFGFSSWLCFCLVVPFLLGYLQIGRNVYAETYFVFVWRCVGVSVCVCV